MTTGTITLNPSYRFEVEFEHADDHVKCSVNGCHVGRARIRADRLIFRCSRNDGTNFPKMPDEHKAGGIVITPLHRLILDPHVRKSLIPIVIRNYLTYYFDHHAGQA